MTKTITLDHITKIEGHAKLNLQVKHSKVTNCELSSTEGSRYFEGMLVGRYFFEAHEITSRICGICSCAHVIAAITAIEDALQYTPSEQTKRLRKLLMLGERIRSHAAHLYFLALPDYFGYESALAMAPKYKSELKDALQLIKVGNNVIKTLAARDLHPVSATVGGWLKLPTKEQLIALRDDLKDIKNAALRTASLISGLKNPDFVSKGEWFSLKTDDGYALLEGAISSGELSFERHKYREFIDEYHEPRSTANFVVREGKRYFVGALARLNNNSGHLSPGALNVLRKSGIRLPSTNPFHNNIAQAIELVHYIDEAIDICSKTEIVPEHVAKLKPRAGIGISAVEVPRGTLWHEYILDGEGKIVKANIITPTAQNLLNIQEDIREFVPTVVEKRRGDIKIEIEKLIRSYDPCFSCSAHFLELNWL